MFDFTSSHQTTTDEKQTTWKGAAQVSQQTWPLAFRNVAFLMQAYAGRHTMECWHISDLCAFRITSVIHFDLTNVCFHTLLLRDRGLGIVRLCDRVRTA